MANKKLNLDKLLDVYCEGIYAMDPKTALPFWDYDFGPIYGDLWIKKMLLAIRRIKESGLTAQDVAKFFENIAVPRKELIYSLVDLKVGKISKKDRMLFVSFWWSVVTETCKTDCMVERSNIVHTQKEIASFIKSLKWAKANAQSARQIGNLAMNLNSLAYGLYTDIFAHNSMENFGSYNVSKYFGGTKHILVIKQWANLRPTELYPEFKKFPFDKLNIFAVYKNIDYIVDIYTHQVYKGNAAQNLVQYCVLIDDKKILNQTKKLEQLNDYLGKVVVRHYRKIQKRGFEAAKRQWVLSRNYQFKDFFKSVGLDWYDKRMLQRVKGKLLLKTDFWDFEKYPREVLFAFWKKCFDPRLDTYYENWPELLAGEVKEYNKTKHEP